MVYEPFATEYSPPATAVLVKHAEALYNERLQLGRVAAVPSNKARDLVKVQEMRQAVA
jgi:hypothetical protein